MVKLFRAQADRIGGKVERAILYSKTQTDFTEEIDKLTGNGIVTAKNANTNNPETKVPVSIDFASILNAIWNKCPSGIY